MTEPRDFGELMREALPSRPAPATLRDWAKARAHDAKDLAAQPRIDVIVPVPVARPREFTRMLYAASLIASLALGFGADRVIRGRPAQLGDSTLAEQLVDTHVRSLMPGHLMDVQSTDQHTVKPWFTGRTDFAPRVVDLASDGFPLLGGRMDYVQGHAAAALVYGRRKHVINLFMWPATASPGEGDGNATVGIRGYSVRHWSANSMEFWAVTDAAPAELVSLQQALQRTQ